MRIGDNGLSDRMFLGRHDGEDFGECEADPFGRFLATAAHSGEIRLWNVSGSQGPTKVDFQHDIFGFVISKDGSHLYAMADLPEKTGGDLWVWSIDESSLSLRRRLEHVDFGHWDFDPIGLRFAFARPHPAHSLWSLGAPAAAEPIVLRRGPADYVHQPEFSPDGRWLATCDYGGLTLWPLVRHLPAVIRLDLDYWVGGLEFGPEGRFLAMSADGAVSLHPLEGSVPPAGHTVSEFEGNRILNDVAISPDGELFAVSCNNGEVWIGREAGEEFHQLPGPEAPGSDNVAFSPDGRFVAALTGYWDPTSDVFRVWETSSSKEIMAFSLNDDEFRLGSSFTTDGRLLTGTSRTLRQATTKSSSWPTWADLSPATMADVCW
jgi:WD40 repeat protein